ncbi:MAG: hypothetical protein H6994_11180 [Pseudomonadales bacterium]|nr:hypothetical protein [Pseudomonadales bacterium]
MLIKLLKWLVGLVAVAGLCLGATVLVLRFGDGPTGMIAGGAFTTGEPWQGDEPDWSFLTDRQEVEFQLLDPERSRTTWIVAHEGRIYIPSGYMTSALGKLWKQWPPEAEKDGRAILRVDGRLYPRRLVRIQESPALPAIISELQRKYLGGLGPDGVASDDIIRSGLDQVKSGSLWVFELAPR